MAAVAGLYGFGDDTRTVAARFVERQRLANKDSPTDTYVRSGGRRDDGREGDSVQRARDGMGGGRLKCI